MALSYDEAPKGSTTWNTLPLLKDVIGSGSKVDAFVGWCLNHNEPMVLMDNGSLDISRLLSRNGSPPDWENVQVIMDIHNPFRDQEESLSSEIRILLGAEPATPCYDTFIDGKYTIFLGDAAIRFYQQELLGQTYKVYDISPPVLMLMGTDATPIAADASATGYSLQLNVLYFVATFGTKYGESGISNMVTVLSSGWTYCDLAIDTQKIPSSAEYVYYYRNFGDTFFRVAEVEIA